jgi:hypothetical protein
MRIDRVMAALLAGFSGTAPVCAAVRWEEPRGTAEFRLEGPDVVRYSDAQPAGRLPLAATRFGARFAQVDQAVQALGAAVAALDQGIADKRDQLGYDQRLSAADAAHLASLNAQLPRIEGTRRSLAAARDALKDKLAALEAAGEAGTAAYEDVLGQLDANAEATRLNELEAGANAKDRAAMQDEIRSLAAQQAALSGAIDGLSAQRQAKNAELARQRAAATDLYALKSKLAAAYVFEPDELAAGQRDAVRTLAEDFAGGLWRGGPAGALALSGRVAFTGRYHRTRAGEGTRTYPWSMAVRCALSGDNPGAVTLDCGTEIAYFPGNGGMSDWPEGRFHCSFASGNLGDRTQLDCSAKNVTFSGHVVLRARGDALVIVAFRFEDDADGDDYEGGF